MGVRSPCGTVRYADRLPAAGHRFRRCEDRRRRQARRAGLLHRFAAVEQLAAEKERLEREVRRRQQQEPIDWKSIRNDVSNENAKLDESLRDDRGTNTAALNDAADAAQERMRANREAYERDWPKPKPSAAGGSGPTSAEKAPTARCRAA